MGAKQIGQKIDWMSVQLIIFLLRWGSFSLTTHSYMSSKHPLFHSACSLSLCSTLCYKKDLNTVSSKRNSSISFNVLVLTKSKGFFQVWLSLKLLSERTGIVVTDPENIQTRLVTDPRKIETRLISSCESRNDLQVSRKHQAKIQELTACFRFWGGICILSNVGEASLKRGGGNQPSLGDATIVSRVTLECTVHCAPCTVSLQNAACRANLHLNSNQLVTSSTRQGQSGPKRRTKGNFEVQVFDLVQFLWREDFVCSKPASSSLLLLVLCLVLFPSWQGSLFWRVLLLLNHAFSGAGP